jgi:hypothetical protein
MSAVSAQRNKKRDKKRKVEVVVVGVVPAVRDVVPREVLSEQLFDMDIQDSGISF